MSTIFPNLETICRLCLKENAGTVDIFTQHNAAVTTGSNISIPMRLMACTALEVQNTSDMPNKICLSCRYQLEKSYYFRKRSQASDGKLRKHLRLINMGRKSRVFSKDEDDEDDDDELEFKDSLDFIKAQEDDMAKSEERKFEQYKKQVKVETEQELNKFKSQLEEECLKKLKPKVRAVLEHDLKMKWESERDKLKKESLQEAKRLVYDEVKEECRGKEMKSLLNELEDFLKYKNNTIPLRSRNRVLEEGEDGEIDNSANDKFKILKLQIRKEAPNVAHTKLGIRDVDTFTNEPSKSSSKMIDKLKATTSKSLLQDRNDDETTAQTTCNALVRHEGEQNDSDVDYMIYNDLDGTTLNMPHESSNDEDSSGNKLINSCELIEDMNTDFPISDEEHTDSTEEAPTNTTYQIKGDDNGEITFLKKTIHLSNMTDDTSEGNLMVIDFTEDMVDRLNVIELEEKKAPGMKITQNVNTIAERGDYARTKERTATTTTIQTTMLTKTYCNPLQRTTDTAKTFKCIDCPMVFSMQKALERHVRAHRKSKQTGITFECPQCHCVLSCKSALRRHMNVHSAHKPYACDECGKAFVQREILKRHMLTHTDIKPHQCFHCDKSFAQRVNLTQHINRHHMEQPHIEQYNCPLCPKTFHHASGLSRHLASHGGVAYQCTECERTFGDRSSVKRHIVNMHGKGNMAKMNIKAS